MFCSDEESGPPSGVTVRYRQDTLRFTVKGHGLIRAAVLLVWIIGTGILVLDRFFPAVLDWQLTRDLAFSTLLAGWAMATFLVWNVMTIRTVIVADPLQIRAVHYPWHVPFASKVSTADVKHVEIETVERKRGSGYDEEASSYTFYLRLSLFSESFHPILFRTSNEQQAVYLRRILQAYIADHQASTGAAE